MNGYGSVGSLFAGLMQGIVQGQQAQSELQHKKDVLKLEQDKIKLAEREAQLRSATDLKTAMMAAESASRTANIHAGSALDVQELQNQGALAASNSAAATNLAGRMLDIQSAEKIASERNVAEKQIANIRETPQELPAIRAAQWLIKQGYPPEKAMGLAFKGTDESLRTKIITAVISASMGGPVDPTYINTLMAMLEPEKTFSAADIFGGGKNKKSITGIPPEFLKKQGKNTTKK